jgi:hypothetical protein
VMAGPPGAALERDALGSILGTITLLAVLGTVWIAVRCIAVSLAKNDEQDVQYEEEPQPAVQELGLYRDGVLPVVSAASQGD